jgi:uncharacterized membrane protein
MRRPSHRDQCSNPPALRLSSVVLAANALSLSSGEKELAFQACVIEVSTRALTEVPLIPWQNAKPEG